MPEQKPTEYITIADGWDGRKRIPREKWPQAKATGEEMRDTALKLGDSMEKASRFLWRIVEDEE